MDSDKENESLVVIPGLGATEIAFLESLLQAACIYYLSLPGDYWARSPRLLIRTSDVIRVKELLKNFRIKMWNGSLAPIPW